MMLIGVGDARGGEDRQAGGADGERSDPVEAPEAGAGERCVDREDREQGRKRGGHEPVARLDALRDVFEQAAAEGGNAAEQEQGGESLLGLVARRAEGHDPGHQSERDADAADARHGAEVKLLRSAEVVVGREPGMRMARPDDQQGAQRRHAERQEEQQHGWSLGSLGPFLSVPGHAALRATLPRRWSSWPRQRPLRGRSRRHRASRPPVGPIRDRQLLS